jgi:RNA ligase (TIGR02306 family)
MFSAGILYPVSGGFHEPLSGEYSQTPCMCIDVDNDVRDMHGNFVFDNGVETMEVEFDTDYAQTLEIVKYESPVPIHMAGEVMALFGVPAKYDFENLKSVPDMFDDFDMVVATEKLHGTFVQFGCVHGLHHEELFGKNKNIYVCSKGLGSQGLVFKNNEQNKNNLYVKALNKLLANGLDEYLNDVVNESNLAFRIFGEIYGGNVQDLSYDCKEPAFAAFDMMHGDDFVSYSGFFVNAAQWHIPIVPELYLGGYYHDELLKLRDGKTMLGGKNIREGLVVKTWNNSKHPVHGRKIAKMVSPDYLLRKGTVTEYN